MVSLGTITKLGSLAIAGFLGYTLLKNAGSIGSSVGTFAGTGLRNLGSGISEGFTTAFDIFGGNVNANTSGTVSRGFAETYSGASPASSGQLDVSKTFAYISSSDYRDNQAKSTNNFGGFGSAQGQTEALASAIAESASNYPEWFA